MKVTRRLLPPFLAATALLLATGGLLGRAAGQERAPIDREEHPTVQTATFALG